MTRRRLYEAVAYKFQTAQEDTVPVDELLKECADEGNQFAWSVSRGELANALSLKGINLEDGKLTMATEQRSYLPGISGYAEFKKAAKHAMRWRGEPIEAIDLIELTGLSGEQVPYAAMKEVLGQIGLRHIPGHGYWKYPIFSDPLTRSVSVSSLPKRIGGVIPMFRQYGWPLAGRDIEEYGGTPSKSVSQVASRGNVFVRPIGIGLYVPADQHGDIPMSANVANRLLGFKPDEWISTVEDLRSFRIACLMARKELAAVKISRVASRGKRVQRLLFEPSREGLKLLLRAAKVPAEVF